MPSVPPRGIPSIRQEITPSARLNAGGAGAGLAALARGVNDMARAHNQALIEEKSKADQIAVMNADTKLGEAVSSIENDVRQLRGRNAFGAASEVPTRYDKAISEAAQDLANDTQRLAFEGISRRRREQLNRSVQAHMSREIRAFDDQSSKAAVEVAKRNAASNYRDSERRGEEFARIRETVRLFGERQGLPADAISLMQEDAVSEGHLAVINQIIADGDDRYLKAYALSMKDEIRPDEFERVMKTVEELGLRKESQRKSDSIFDENPDDENAALSEARKIEDPKQRDDVVNRLKNRFAEKRRVEKIEKDSLLQKYGSIIEKGASIDQIPDNDWQRMDLADREFLRKYEAVVKGRGQNPSAKAFVEFLEMQPEQLAAMTEADLRRKFRVRVSSGDWDQIRQEWDQTRRAMGGDQEARRTMSANVSFNQLFDREIRRLGIVPNKTLSSMSEGDAQNYRTLMNIADREINAFEHSKGSTASPEDRRRIVDSVLDQVKSGPRVRIDDGIFFDSEKPTILVTKDEAAAAYVPSKEIPDVMKQRLRSAARANTIGLSDARLEQVYAMALLGRESDLAAALGFESVQEMRDYVRRQEGDQ